MVLQSNYQIMAGKIYTIIFKKSVPTWLLKYGTIFCLDK